MKNVDYVRINNVNPLYIIMMISIDFTDLLYFN